MHYGWPSPSLPKLLGDEYHFTVSNEEGSSIAILSLLGDVFGAFIGAALLDRIGRKNTILLSSLPFIISWLMIANSPNIYVLYAARIMAGIADGLAFTAVPMYLGEIAEPKIRGLLCSSCVTIMILGMLVIQCIGSYLSIVTTAYISCFVPVLLLCTFTFMPESPYYLIIKEKFELAKSNLQLLRGTDEVDVEMIRITNAIKEQMHEKSSILDLFKVKSNRKACFIMLGLRTVQQLSGVTAFTFYANTIFLEAGVESPTTTSLIYFTVQLTATMLSSLILDKTGRRPLVLISTIGASVALFTEGLYFYLSTCTNVDMSEFQIVPAVALISFIVVFSLGLQTIPILLLGELFPTDVKAFALSLADVYFSIIASIIAKFFQFMKDDFGMHVPFFLFAAFCLIGFVFSYYCIPETKGKTLEDIQLFLKGQTSDDAKENSNNISKA